MKREKKKESNFVGRKLREEEQQVFQWDVFPVGNVSFDILSKEKIFL